MLAFIFLFAVLKSALFFLPQDSTYMTMKHKSFIAAGQPKKTTVQLKGPVNAYKPVANHAGNIAHEKLKKIEGKKSRDDKERVLEVLFGLFEKHQYYNIKDLAKGTKQPITYLKEILNEVCHYLYFIGYLYCIATILSCNYFYYCHYVR